jgi:hypothetical protein
VAKQMGESGSVWTPHHQQVTRWKQIHHRWVGECVAKPPPTRDWTHHLQRIKWESYCGITWNRNTILFFSTRRFTVAHFGLGLSRDQGASNQSWIIESKIYGQTPIIYVLRPSTTTTPTHMCKLVDTFYNCQFVVQAWSSSLKLYVAPTKWFWPKKFAQFVEAVKLCTSEKKV